VPVQSALEPPPDVPDLKNLYENPGRQPRTVISSTISLISLDWIGEHMDVDIIRPTLALNSHLLGLPGLG
jgi:hypothetical protein